MPGVFRDIRQTKQKLELIDKDRYRGAVVWLRAEHGAAGKRATKRASGIAKAHAKRYQIDEVILKGHTTP